MLLHYKGTGAFGTILGGCISLTVNTFAAVFIIAQLYALLFQPGYDQTSAINYLSRKTAKLYDVPVKDFLPTFGVVSRTHESDQYFFNDKDLVTWEWYMTDTQDEVVHYGVETVDCSELVDSWTELSED